MSCRLLLLLPLLLLELLSTSGTTLAKRSYDLVVYGGTPAGIAAAIAAWEAGLARVLLVDPTAHVGGMASPGGIGLIDSGRDGARHLDAIRVNNGSQYRYAMRNAAHYANVSTPVWQPDACGAKRSVKSGLRHAADGKGRPDNHHHHHQIILVLFSQAEVMMASVFHEPAWDML